MNKLKMLAVAFALVPTLGAVTAFADETPAAKPTPCKNIMAACKAAGYAPHAKDKDLRKDCMKPIMHGQAVEGVTVDPADVPACQAKMHDRHQH